MTLATIEYTDANQMLADYAARRRQFYAKPSPAVMPEPANPPKPVRFPVVYRTRVGGGVPYTPDECAMIASMAAENWSTRAIASKLNRPIEGITKKARLLGVTIHARPTREFPSAVRGEDITRHYKLVVSQDRSSKIRIRGIIQVCAGRYGILPDDILSNARTLAIALARQQAIWLSAKETKLSMAEIGRIFGRDHTTVIHAIRRENDRTGENVRGLGGARK